MAVTLGDVYTPTQAERNERARLAKRQELYPLIDHACSVPPASDLPKDAKEGQTWACPKCKSEFALHYNEMGLESGGGVTLDKATVVCWRRLSGGRLYKEEVS